jgi:hypothetical protein
MPGTMFGMGLSPVYPIAPTPWPYNAYGTQNLSQLPLPHILQLVQSVPQQLQQIQSLQQQQLLYVQQLVQLIPAQLQQLQQLIQSVPLQASSLQPLGPSLTGPFGFGVLPQPFATQPPNQVM